MRNKKTLGSQTMGDSEAGSGLGGSGAVTRFGAKRQKVKTRQWGQPGLEFILFVLFVPGFRLLSGLRGLLFDHAFRLRTFLSLNNFELDVIAFLEALITLRLDGTVMDEHIGPIIPANKAEALCVIEPFHFTFDSRHVPYSLRSPKTPACVVR
jgi:hypothetical protein